MAVNPLQGLQVALARHEQAIARVLPAGQLQQALAQGLQPLALFGRDDEFARRFGLRPQRPGTFAALVPLVPHLQHRDASGQVGGFDQATVANDALIHETILMHLYNLRRQSTGSSGAGEWQLLDLVGWLSIHGTTELFAILLAGAAGLHIGRSMAFPGARPVLAAASEAGQRGAVVMVGVVIMMIVAALLEAFPRQLVDGTESRFLIGGVMLIFWLAYFILYRPSAAQETA